LEKKPVVTSELRRLQFYGAGPKTALPNVTDSGNDGDGDDALTVKNSVWNMLRRM